MFELPFNHDIKRNTQPQWAIEARYAVKLAYESNRGIL